MPKLIFVASIIAEIRVFRVCESTLILMLRRLLCTLYSYLRIFPKSFSTPHFPQQIRQSSKDSTGSSDSDSSSDDESLPNTTPSVPSGNEPPPEKAQKETEAGAEISALVNYVQPIHFSSFENAESK